MTDKTSAALPLPARATVVRNAALESARQIGFDPDAPIDYVNHVRTLGDLIANLVHLQTARFCLSTADNTVTDAALTAFWSSLGADAKEDQS